MKKKALIWGIVCLLLMVCVPGVVSAASLRDIIKFGIVDMGRVYNEYAARSEEARNLREKRTRLNREIREEVAAIRRMEDDLRSRMRDASESERRRRTAEIEFRKDELASYLARRNNELDREEADIIRPMRDDISEAIRFVANRQGIKIVLDRLYTIHSDIDLDITEAVLARIRLILSQRAR
jgi:outer membrane protein